MESITAKGSQYARSLIEASLDPLITISTEGKITDMNEALSEITGFSREKLEGTNFFNYFTEPKKAMDVYQGVFAEGFVLDFPLTIRHKEGKLTDVLFNGSLYKDEIGNVLGAVVVARDITLQKKISKELMEAKVFAELAATIAEEAKLKAENATIIAVNATRIAEDSTRIAEDAVRTKQQFLSNMSHEIRTPMNAIIGFTKVLLKTESTQKQREYLNAIKLSGDALIVLINDILDLAKVDAGKMAFEVTPFKMASSISAMLHIFEAKIQEKNLQLIQEYDPNIPEVLLGDSLRLHQIILNLLSNAVKFTSIGQIRVSVKLISEDDNKVEIQFGITDTGIGIHKSEMEKIFENFQQASSKTSRLYGGTGLGLAIVKQLVESQGGIIKVTSEIGFGSTFSFSLHFNKTNKIPESEIMFEELENKIKNINVKILVVEDIPLNQLLMKTVLDDFGFQKVIAANGKIAVEILQKEEFNLILMDLQMPEMNGFEATEYIRNVLKLKIPIIALTADVTTVDLEKCKAVGMNDYIAKPLDERLLYNKIISLVKKQEKIKKIPLEQMTKIIYTNLSYLKKRTKENPPLMIEMISIFLEQTPTLIKLMKESLDNKDWESLYSSVHKFIPSLSIMGMHSEFESMAIKIQEYSSIRNEEKEIISLLNKLEIACEFACSELLLELNNIKHKLNEK